MRFLNYKGHPTSDLLISTMRTFARAGLDRFNQTTIQRRLPSTVLSPLLPGFVGSQDPEINSDLDATKLLSSESKFWALPEMSGDNTFIAFFRVKRLIARTNSTPDVKVELFLLWHQGTDSAGFRFEMGGRGRSDRHAYPHMQLSSDFHSPLAGNLTTGTPTFLSKCPAIPLPAMIPYTNWFSCLLALAGHQGDEVVGLTRTFADLSTYHQDGEHSEVLAALKKTVSTLVKREQSLLESACSIASNPRWLLAQSWPF